jgi:hypothetical protein
MPSIRLVADGGRLLPLGIVAALPPGQRPNVIDFCSRHAEPEKHNIPTTSGSCSHTRYRHASRHMRCSSMYDDEGDAWAAAGLVSHPRHANNHLLCTTALLGDFPTIEGPNGVAIACSLSTGNTLTTPSYAWRFWPRH